MRTCTSPATCGGGGVANQCGCETPAGLCLRVGAQCGELTAESCGECTGDIACAEAGTANRCDFIDPRDDQPYPVTKIGTQLWFARNLNFLVNDLFCASGDDYASTRAPTHPPAARIAGSPSWPAVPPPT